MQNFFLEIKISEVVKTPDCREAGYSKYFRLIQTGKKLLQSSAGR